jgi:hypothetical protein
VPDIEDSVERAWNPLVRPMVAEAWRCYNAGAIRASIAATWTAVTADLIDKIVRLADEGDGGALAFRTQIEAARAKGIDPKGVRDMQAIEAKLLETAEQLELIDSIGVRELERIREDRHLCVHPSLRQLGEVYEPRAEVARAHLAVALETLLTHPPTRGRKVLEQFKAYVCDPLFSRSPRYVKATFFDRVRAATRRNIVEVAAKHALLELPSTGYSVAATTVADRMADCVKDFAQRDRVLVRETTENLAGRFGGLDGAVQIRALARLGDQDFFWDMIDPPLANRLNGLVAVADVGDDRWSPIPVETAAMLSLVRDENARNHLPSLMARFKELEPWRRAQIAAIHPDEFFSGYVADFLDDAPSFRSAENIGQTVVVPHGRFYTMDELRRVLHAWQQNEQCRIAAKMPGLAVELLAATAHLGDERYTVFREFLNSVRSKEPPDSYYTYDELEAELVAAGH